jgi:tRNA-(ms[2]io[6]A)-hydroxylase
MPVKLIRPTSAEWLAKVLSNFDEFLLDHAANEKKASSMALAMVAHYPDKKRLTSAMVDLALEELNHFRQVFRLTCNRGLSLADDQKDPYVNGLQKHMRRQSKQSNEYLLDRLLSAAVIETRGAERFTLLAKQLSDPMLQTFYQTLAKSEYSHGDLFIDLADCYFSSEQVNQRLAQWVQIEDNVLQSLSIRARLH